MVEDAIDSSAEPRQDRMLRLFVAVPLWNEFRERNTVHLKSLRSLDIDLKWVPQENWHITLKFLGQVPASKVHDLTESIGAVLKGSNLFTFSIGGLGGFPRLSKCRVLWVGVQEGRRELIDLAHQVEEACRDAGFPGDRKNFQAHLTMGRSRKESLKIQVPKELFEVSWGEERVDSVALVKSELGPGGAKYEILETIRFEP